MKDIFLRIADLRTGNKSFCIITVVETTGTTPRKAGARGIVLDDGSMEGTVGGGSIEMEAIETAKEVLKSGKPLLKDYVLQDLKDEMICGGSMRLFYEPIYPQKCLTIFGAGHVGRAIAHIAYHAGWKIRIIDQRDGVLSPHFFPPQAELIAESYVNYIKNNSFNANDWLVIVTPKHEFDEEVLGLLVQYDVPYLGMLGSVQKVNEVMENLKQRGIKPDVLAKVYAPIGLNIGKETPGEIAMSIVAEMLAVLYGLNEIFSLRKV